MKPKVQLSEEDQKRIESFDSNLKLLCEKLARQAHADYERMPAEFLRDENRVYMLMKSVYIQGPIPRLVAGAGHVSSARVNSILKDQNPNQKSKAMFQKLWEWVISERDFFMASHQVSKIRNGEATYTDIQKSRVVNETGSTIERKDININKKVLEYKEVHLEVAQIQKGVMEIADRLSRAGHLPREFAQAIDRLGIRRVTEPLPRPEQTGRAGEGEPEIVLQAVSEPEKVHAADSDE